MRGQRRAVNGDIVGNRQGRGQIDGCPRKRRVEGDGAARANVQERLTQRPRAAIGIAGDGDGAGGRKDIGRPSVPGQIVAAIAIHAGGIAVFQPRANDDSVSIHANLCLAEIVTGARIGCFQILLLCPCDAAASEEITRPGV